MSDESFSPDESKIHIEIGFDQLNNSEFGNVIVAWDLAKHHLYHFLPALKHKAVGDSEIEKVDYSLCKVINREKSLVNTIVAA